MNSTRDTARFGSYGGTLITGSVNQTPGPWVRLVALTQCSFTTLTIAGFSLSGTIGSLALAATAVIDGLITDVTLASGTAVLYRLRSY